MGFTANTNNWNKIRYTIYTPVYDMVARYFARSRKLSIEALKIEKGDNILIVGAGTGLDLEFLPMDCKIVATDITPAMVDRIKARNKHLNRNVEAVVMDGQSLQFSDESFDKIIMHLILAVIPDPIACIKEAERVLKDGGEIAVFDKFIGKNKKVSVLRKLINVLTNLLFSDITRDIYLLVKNTNLTVVSDQPANLKGNFRLIKLEGSTPILVENH